MTSNPRFENGFEHLFTYTRVHDAIEPFPLIGVPEDYIPYRGAVERHPVFEQYPISAKVGYDQFVT